MFPEEIKFLGDVEVVSAIENARTLRTEVCVAVILIPTENASVEDRAGEDFIRVSLQIHNCEDFL